VVAAVAAGSWYFLRQPLKRYGTEGQISTSVTTKESTLTSSTSAELKESATISSETATAGEGFNFPVTWNGDKATEVNLVDYRLTVDGDVSNPLELTLDDLHGMPSVKKTLNIACVEGWEADVPWEGILLSHILSLAGAPKNLDYIAFKAVTGYGARIPSNDVNNPDNMIALKAGDAPLTITHGYPTRLVVPTRPGVD
jgi:DMSO/TMAO reductase YedYZ molybdopterin-dependent catalytic subunit